MQDLIGYAFPGGTYRIESWENFLVHDVMLVSPGKDGLAHPLYFFHIPVSGLGVTIQDIFDLCRAESPGAVRAGEYVWDIRHPLREGNTYRVAGKITAVERKSGRRSGLMDLVTFDTDIFEIDTDTLVATVSNTWIFLRAAA